MSETETMTWTGGGTKRLVQRDTPRGLAECRRCGRELDYECGSLHWQAVAEDLCGGCAGIEAAERILARVRCDLALPHQVSTDGE